MDPRVGAVLDVIAPVRDFGDGKPSRSPIFEWPHETTPTDDELQELAEKVVAAIDGV